MIVFISDETTINLVMEDLSTTTTAGNQIAGCGPVEAESVVVEMASVKSDDEKLTGHLQSPDFFDVAKYPKATFESTEIKKGGDKGATHTVTGNLDFHGVKKSITFPA